MYSRCRYICVVYADISSRALCSVSRGLIAQYVAAACGEMDCILHAQSLGEGVLKMLVELGPEVSADGFMSRFKQLTTMWIAEHCRVNFDSGSYWLDKSHMLAVSPEDAEITLQALGTSDSCSLATPNHPLHDMPWLLGAEKGNALDANINHLILVTARGTMALPMKYRKELETAARNLCRELGAHDSQVVAMRNHLHILLPIPSSLPVGRFAGLLAADLENWMSENPRFCKFGGWSEHQFCYTVSAQRVRQEESDLLHQEEIHRPFRIPNEMSHLYRKLQIPYVISLK